MHPVTSENLEFLDRIETELKRAERYRIFLSMVIVDLSVYLNGGTNGSQELLNQVHSVLKNSIRIIDDVAVVGGNRLGLLFPETSRQGAELAAKRLAEVIKNSLPSIMDDSAAAVIPLEMASFPDAAGTKTIPEIIREFTPVN